MARMIGDDPLVAIVVGASSGIGRATATRLAASGARVAALARSTDRLTSVSSEIRRTGGVCLPISVDIRDESATVAIFDRVVQQMGPPRVVVNCAAIGIQSSLCGGELSDWRAMMEVNVLGMALVCRESVRCFDKESGGHLINVLSTSAHRLTHEAGVYAVTKHATRALTELLRIEVERYGLAVRVSAISPGRTNTALFGPKPDRSSYLDADEVATLITSMVFSTGGIQFDDLIVCRQEGPI